MNEKEKTIRLLMVDDEEDFLAATVKALARRGIDVKPVTNGKEALTQAKYGGFDVVLLDIKMPEMDGEELFQRLQSQEPDLPAIILTGHGTVSQAFRTSKEGVIDYIAKPCDMDDLAERIREAAHKGTARAEEIQVLGNKTSVLMVDDETELLESLQTVLERRDMIVTTAENGKRALELLSEVYIDVVVLDIKMPGLDGLEVLQRIKREKPDVEVLLLTGHPTVDTALQGVKMGAAEYLTKPPDVEKLTKLIHEARERRREAVEAFQQQQIREIMDRFND
jgi:DNA-binding NtrC family response regulator